MLSLVAGLAGGAIHALSGPDHLAAVTPLSLGDRWRGARAGLEWGIGHGAGVGLLGLVAIAAHQAVPVDVLSGWSESFVGFVLLGIGAWALLRGYRFSSARPDADHEVAPPHHHRSATLGLGALHGSAGAGHLVAVLPAAGLSTFGAAIYLVSYVLGAAAAMATVGALAGEISARGGRRFLPLILAGSGACAMVVGACWIVGSFY